MVDGILTGTLVDIYLRQLVVDIVAAVVVVGDFEPSVFGVVVGSTLADEGAFDETLKTVEVTGICELSDS